MDPSPEPQARHHQPLRYETAWELPDEPGDADLVDEIAEADVNPDAVAAGPGADQKATPPDPDRFAVVWAIEDLR